MTAQQIKSEIQKTLDEIPESTLQEILDYLKSLKGKSGNELQRSQLIKKILTEDKNLLERLAQ